MAGKQMAKGKIECHNVHLHMLHINLGGLQYQLTYTTLDMKEQQDMERRSAANWQA